MVPTENKVHNRLVARFVFSVLDARDWSEARLAKELGLPRTQVSMHLSGKRRIQAGHLMKYLGALNHHERPALLEAWIRDNATQELADDLLEMHGNLVANELPLTIDENNRRMLTWLAIEIERDGELAELFKMISVRVGYRPSRTPKRRRRR